MADFEAKRTREYGANASFRGETRSLTYGDGGVAGEVHEGVLEHAAVARGEHEAVAVEPGVVLGVVSHRLTVNDVTHGGAAHGKTGVAGVRLVDGINREEANGVDAVLDGVRGHVGRGPQPRRGRASSARAETRTFLAALVTLAPAKEALSAAIWEAIAAIFP